MSNGALTPIPDLTDLRSYTGYTDPRAYTGYPALQGLPPPAAIAQAPTPAPAIAQSTTPAGPAIAQPSPIQQPTAPQGSTEWQQQRQQKILDQQTYERGQTLEKQFEQAQIKPWQDLGTGGKIARVAETIGGVMFPGFVSRIPGSPINMALRQQEAEKGLATMEQLQNQQMEARARMIAAEQAKHQLVTTPEGTFSVAYDPTGQPQVSELKTPAGLPMYPAGKTTEEQAYDYYMHGGPGGGPRLDPKGQPYDPMSVIEVVTGAKLGDDRKQAMNALKAANPGMNDYQAYMATEKPGAVPHITIMGPDNKPHVMGLDPTTGQYSQDLGEAPPTATQVGPQQTVWVPKDANDFDKGFQAVNVQAGVNIPANAMTEAEATKTSLDLRTAKSLYSAAEDYVKNGERDAQGNATGKHTGAGDWNLIMRFNDASKTGNMRFTQYEAMQEIERTRNLIESMRLQIGRFIDPNAPLLTDRQRNNFLAVMGRAVNSKVGVGGFSGQGGTPAAQTQPPPRGAAAGQGMKYQKGDQFVRNGRLLEFKGGDNKPENWKDTGPAPAGTPPGIFIPQPVAPAVRPGTLGP